MSERQPTHRQPSFLRRVALAGILASSGLVGAPLTSQDAMGAMTENPNTTTATLDTTCVPYTSKLLAKRSTPYSLTARRAIIVGDISIENKGFYPDKSSLSRELTIINLPATATQSGIVSKYGDSYVEIFNSCATTTQFRAEIGRLELLNTPSGSAKSSVDTHKITTTASEPHTDPVPACDTKWLPIEIPATGENGTTALRSIKRAVITGDIKVHNAQFDSNQNTGETIIVDFPSTGDLTGINAPWGGFAKVMTSCASSNDFYATIGSTNKTQASNFSEGEQTFYINTP